MLLYKNSVAVIRRSTVYTAYAECTKAPAPLYADYTMAPALSYTCSGTKRPSGIKNNGSEFSAGYACAAWSNFIQLKSAQVAHALPADQLYTVKIGPSCTSAHALLAENSLRKCMNNPNDVIVYRMEPASCYVHYRRELVASCLTAGSSDRRHSTYW